MSLPPWLREPAEAFERLVAGGRMPHALLMHGPGGWGKALLANHCALSLVGADAAADARNLAHADLRWIDATPPATTIKIDQIRELTAFMQRTASQSEAKAAVLNRAHCMNLNAANALLKTLEEPPPGSYLILVSDAPQQLPATVRSRCQGIAVRPGAAEDAEAWLAEQGYPADRGAPLLAELGGAPVRAREALERGEAPIWERLQAVAAGRASTLDAAQEWAGEDLPELLGRWLRLVHRLTLEAADPRRLLRFETELTALRAAAMANSSLNAQLQLDRMLIHWRMAAAKA